MPSYNALKRVADKEEQERTINRLLRLRQQLAAEIPAKTATDTLLLATWNIREFGGNRHDESLHYIAEIISRFDLVAIQEVAPDLSGLEKVVSLLGRNWSYLVTDSTDGTAGGSERTAFVFDRCKVFSRNLVGEIVLPQTRLIEGGLQFARTPFCAAFQAGWFKFILTTVHIYYGQSSGVDSRRLAEIDTIADFLAKRAKKEEANYILLGDFNIVKLGDATFQALEKHGFHVPNALKAHPSDLGKTKHYDQIAFNLKLNADMTVFSEQSQRAGAFNFTKSIYTPEDLDVYQKYFDEKNVKGKTAAAIEKYYLSTWRTFQTSDHLPLWVELKVDFSDAHLRRLLK